MLGFTVLILAASFCFWYIIKYILWTIRAANMVANIPGPKPLPIIGNSLMFAGIKSLEEVFKVFTSFFNGYLTRDMIGRIWLGPKLVICIGNPTHIEKILSNPDALQKDNIYERLRLLGNGLFVRNGKEWHELRKPLDKLITKKMVESNISVFQEKALKICNMMKKHAETGLEFNLKGFTVNFAMEVLCVTSFGCEINLNENDGIKLKETLEKCFGLIVKSIVQTPYNISLTFTKFYMRGRRFNQMVKPFWILCNEFLQGRLRNRKLMQEDDQSLPQYYSDVLLEKATKDKLSFEDSGKLATDFFIAGSDTSAVTLHYTLFLLAVFPEHQEAVYREQIDIFGDSPEIEPTWEQLSKMEYLTRILKEVMRLYCPVGIFRKPTSDIDLGDYKLPKGATLFIILYTLHRNLKLWSHPYEFYPDHFLPEECARRPKGSYIPFSLGPRSCPGSVYAMASLKIAVSTAIRRYKFETGVKFEEIEYKYGFLLEPKQEYLVRITNRAPLP
ncbi:cytochrome P450 4c3-like isoform X2 [Rhodnius prolixus]|uniref:cytochrome P450 4c3-like isoform X2 n=1 Tax=Rhodnius prolixus TaxID=13249 RepID=UPI003D18CF8B